MRNGDYEAYEAHLANDRALYAYAETLFMRAPRQMEPSPAQMGP